MPNHSRRQRHSRKRVKGGAGGADHAALVFGNVPHTAVPGSNVIAMNDPSKFAMVGGSAVPVVQAGEQGPVVTGYVAPAVGGLTPFAGGLRKKRGGTALLDDIAIPALFITANQMLGSRRRKTANKNKRKRTRFSRKVR